MDKQIYKHLIYWEISGLCGTNKSLYKYLTFTVYIPSITVGALVRVASKWQALRVFMAARG